MQQIRRIGVFVDLIGAYGRGIFLGLRKYAEEVGNWHCRFPSTWPVGNDVDISDWNVDGWIGYSNDHKLGALMRERPTPLVSVSTEEAMRGRPAVAPHNEAIGQMAFDYLLERGLGHFAFVGHSSAPFSVLRQAGFVRAATEYGRPCHLFPDYLYTPRSYGQLGRWLVGLPKPIGLLADNDDIGAVVLDVCREVSLAVPQDIAVLSVDNDELLCTVRVPTLSSIQLDTYRIGYEAAATLDRMLSGESAPSKPLLVPPLYVVTRQSTDVLAFADSEMRRAIEFIRGRVAQPTTAADVIANATVSARPLEQRFRKQLHCSILDYIHRVHVEHAMSLLSSTRLSVSEVARASGFTSLTRMGIVFRRLAGRTPSEYRRRVTGG